MEAKVDLPRRWIGPLHTKPGKGSLIGKTIVIAKDDGVVPYLIAPLSLWRDHAKAIANGVLDPEDDALI